MADRGCPLQPMPLPAEVRESLAELELELSEGERPCRGAPPGSHLRPGTPAMLLAPGHPATTRDPRPGTPAMLLAPGHPAPPLARTLSPAVTRDPRLARRSPGELAWSLTPGPWLPGPSGFLAPAARTFGCPRVAWGGLASGA